ncbi:MAG: Hint domain-containing protein [Myxococcota bacterium]
MPTDFRHRRLLAAQGLFALHAVLYGCGFFSSCFVRGTRIATPKGPRPIEDLQIGDEVHSWSFEASTVVTRKVTACLNAQAAETLRVEAGELVIEGVSPEHPFWDVKGQRWVRADELHEGTALWAWIGADAREQPITRIVRGEGAEVFNLTVDGEHNYFAEGLLVHNKSPVDDTDFRDTATVAPTDTDRDAPVCFQQRAVDNGQVSVTETVLALSDTLAVLTDEPPPATPLPTGFESAPFYGAVDPASAEAWWEGWTAIDPAFDGGLPGARFHPLQAEIGSGVIMASAQNNCGKLDPAYQDGGTVQVFGQTFPVCIVSERITSDVAWPNSHVFFVTEAVVVGTGDAQLGEGEPSTNVTLTIQAGTQVYFAPGDTTLVVSRGSKLNARGTPDLPIVFAGVPGDALGMTGDPTDLTDRSAWGGLIFSAYGLTNTGGGDEMEAEDAIPRTEERWFGGDDNDDDSGILRYAIIAEAGFESGSGEEYDGLRLEAVGSRTQIDHVQIIGSGDDGIEWHGGAVNLSHVICNGASDDSLDQDLGYVGLVQFALVIFGSESGDRGIESDNNGANFDAAPQTAPVLANLTIIGDVGGDFESVGALHREGWRGQVLRSVFMDGDNGIGGPFEDGCLDIDDTLPSELVYRDVLFDCASPLVECDDD